MPTAAYGYHSGRRHHSPMISPTRRVQRAPYDDDAGSDGSWGFNDPRPPSPTGHRFVHGGGGGRRAQPQPRRSSGGYTDARAHPHPHPFDDDPPRHRSRSGPGHNHGHPHDAHGYRHHHPHPPHAPPSPLRGGGHGDGYGHGHARDTFGSALAQPTQPAGYAHEHAHSHSPSDQYSHGYDLHEGAGRTRVPPYHADYAYAERYEEPPPRAVPPPRAPAEGPWYSAAAQGRGGYDGHGAQGPPMRVDGREHAHAHAHAHTTGTYNDLQDPLLQEAPAYDHPPAPAWVAHRPPTHAECAQCHAPPPPPAARVQNPPTAASTARAHPRPTRGAAGRLSPTPDLHAAAVPVAVTAAPSSSPPRSFLQAYTERKAAAPPPPLRSGASMPDTAVFKSMYRGAGDAYETRPRGEPPPLPLSIPTAAATVTTRAPSPLASRNSDIRAKEVGLYQREAELAEQETRNLRRELKLKDEELERRARDLEAAERRLREAEQRGRAAAGGEKPGRAAGITPRHLQVRAPTVPVVEGVYTLRSGELLNGYPVWGMGMKRIYSGSLGCWLITDDPEDMAQSKGYIRSKNRHRGGMPDEVAPWWVYKDDDWADEPTIDVAFACDGDVRGGSPPSPSRPTSPSRDASWAERPPDSPRHLRSKQPPSSGSPRGSPRLQPRTRGSAKTAYPQPYVPQPLSSTQTPSGARPRSPRGSPKAAMPRGRSRSRSRFDDDGEESEYTRSPRSPVADGPDVKQPPSAGPRTYSPVVAAAVKRPGPPPGASLTSSPRSTYVKSPVRGRGAAGNSFDLASRGDASGMLSHDTRPGSVLGSPRGRGARPSVAWSDREGLLLPGASAAVSAPGVKSPPSPERARGAPRTRPPELHLQRTTSMNTSTGDPDNRHHERHTSPARRSSLAVKVPHSSEGSDELTDIALWTALSEGAFMWKYSSKDEARKKFVRIVALRENGKHSLRMTYEDVDKNPGHTKRQIKMEDVIFFAIGPFHSKSFLKGPSLFMDAGLCFTVRTKSVVLDFEALRQPTLNTFAVGIARLCREQLAHAGAHPPATSQEVHAAQRQAREIWRTNPNYRADAPVRSDERSVHLAG